MRLAIGRRNANDPDSNDGTLLQYINDFISLTMSDDVKLFENFGTFNFTIDETLTDGVYQLGSDVDGENFVNFDSEILISLTDPVNSSVSWSRLFLYQDPQEFYGYWGINNVDILTIGYPTEVLYYDSQLVFRTIPDDSYTINIYGYKQNPELTDVGDPTIPFDYWLRYVAYGAALNYAKDYRFDAESRQMIKNSFQSERKLLLARTHNQIKTQRGLPSF